MKFTKEELNRTRIMLETEMMFYKNKRDSYGMSDPRWHLYDDILVALPTEAKWLGINRDSEYENLVTRPKGSIKKIPDLDMQLKCLYFKDFLAEFYGSNWGGAIKKFCEERSLKTRMVYRQLNGSDDISDELLKEMEAFQKEKKEIK